MDGAAFGYFGHKLQNILKRSSNPEVIVSQTITPGQEFRSLHDQYPNWIFSFAPLLKYLNRASNPDERDI